MKKQLYLFSIFLSACTGPRETIINAETKEKIIGYSADCKYQIGKTRKSEVSDELMKKLNADSLYLGFNDAAFNIAHETLLGGGGTGKYISSKGLKGGDSLAKALRLYGKPIATDIEYWSDEQHRIKWSFEGLFYKDMVILIDTSKGNTVRDGVWVGRIFPIDKKYRRKSTWYKP